MKFHLEKRGLSKMAKLTLERESTQAIGGRNVGIVLLEYQKSG